MREKEKNIQISQDDYLQAFLDATKRKEALKSALEIRKFEIDLYWKRSAYFWAFIAATFAGYGVLQASSSVGLARTDLSVYLSCLGIVFSFGWFCANKGSKQWQENWENHVDMLEDSESGPLYKIVLTRPKADGPGEYVKRLITGPAPLSVSKINQIISLFVTVLWAALLLKSLPPFVSEARIKFNGINWEYAAIIFLTAAACAGFLTLGKTHTGSLQSIATRRTNTIQAPPPPPA